MEKNSNSVLNTICVEKEVKNCSFSPPFRNFTILEYEKLAKINEKKAKCGAETQRFWDENSNPVDFPIYCDNRSCVICKDHKFYKFQKEHKPQIETLKKSIKKPKAWVFTGWRIPLEDLNRKFLQQKLLLLFNLLKRYSVTEFSIHMELKLNQDGTVYVHFHGVTGGINNLRLVQKLWGRVIRNEKAKKLENVGYYVSKYSSKVPLFYDNYQENNYTLLVYKLQMNRFSPKITMSIVNDLSDKIREIQENNFIVQNIKDIWIKNLKRNNREKNIKEKPPPKYYLEDNIEREVYNELKKDGETVYHQYIEDYEKRVNKFSKLTTLEDFL